MAWRSLSREEVLRRLRERRAKQKARTALRDGPEQTIGYGKGWEARCKTIRAQQGHQCRACGVLGESLAVDHTIPRRLWESEEAANAPENLACLCAECHGRKTGVIERTLYGGDPSLLLHHLTVLAQTGPIPSPGQVGDALARVRQHVETA